MDPNYINAIVGVMVFVFGILLSIIGWLIMGRVSKIETATECLPEIQVDLAGMKVKVDTLKSRQDEFCEQATDQGNRLRNIETTINNTERVTVLEGENRRHTEEIEKLRPAVHELTTKVQVALTEIANLKIGNQKAAAQEGRVQPAPPS